MTDKEIIESLKSELQKKDKRLQDQYHEIIYLNNRIKDMEQEQILIMQEHQKFEEEAQKVINKLKAEVKEFEELKKLNENKELLYISKHAYNNLTNLVRQQVCDEIKNKILELTWAKDEKALKFWGQEIDANKILEIIKNTEQEQQ